MDESYRVRMLAEAEAERDRLRAIFEANGGRGVELADELDWWIGRVAALMPR